MSDQPFPSGAPSGTPNDLRAYVAVLRRRKWIVIIVTSHGRRGRVLLLPTDPHVRDDGTRPRAAARPQPAGLQLGDQHGDRDGARLVAGGRRPGRGDRRRGCARAGERERERAGQHDLPGHHLLGAERCRRPGLGPGLRQGYIENRAIEAQRVYDEETQVTREQLTSLQKQLSAAYEDLAQVTAAAASASPAEDRPQSADPVPHDRARTDPYRRRVPHN